MYIYNVYYKLHIVWGFPIALLVKNLLAVPEIWVRCLGGEYPLEKEMAIHSSILAWETAWTGDLGGLQSMRWQRVGHNGAHMYILYKMNVK